MIDIFNQYESYSTKNYEYIFLVDILRASTTDLVLLNNGARKIIFTDNYEKALTLKKNYNTLLVGEINGKKPSLFDYGNSPHELNKINVTGKIIIHFTTNGTPLFKKFSNFDNAFLASFLNAHKVLKKISKRSAIILAGTNGNSAYEDYFFAGYVLSHFSKTLWGHNGIKAVSIYKYFKNKPLILFYLTKNGKNLIKIGHREDIIFSLRRNIVPILPSLKGIT